MYSQFDLDHMDENTYREFQYWDGQISKEALDNPPNYAIMDNMKDIELNSDLMDEYLAIQEAEMNMDAPDSYQLRGTTEEEVEREITGMEVSELLIEMWEEERKREASIQEDLQYTEEDAFRDFISNQHEEFN